MKQWIRPFIMQILSDNLSKNKINPKILIVDDNPTNILLLRTMLQISGYNNIKTTIDSREVINLYRSFEPDLLLLDLKMPYLDGFQVMEQLNEIKGDDYLPVIVITAQGDRENHLKSLELGAKDFISKPFDQVEVMMRIKNMLEMRLLHNEVKENNADLEKKVREKTKHLQDMQLELIQRLLKAAEFKDVDTGFHVSRIGIYSFNLAKLAGLSEIECNNIMYASMMHDIGKIGVPNEILLKPGKLNSKEWEEMKLHTLNGLEILKGSTAPLIKMAEQIALTHHEKWDGTGYPLGLKGEEIPIPSRITAIVDVFDALLSKRPYKDPWSFDQVFTEIKNCKGTHFEPNLVDIFLQNFSLFLNLKERKLDQYFESE